MSNETLLFDLDRDIGEQNDLTAQMPDKAAALAEHLDAYLARVDAQLPSPNPDYEPTLDICGPSRKRGRIPGRVRRER